MLVDDMYCEIKSSNLISLLGSIMSTPLDESGADIIIPVHNQYGYTRNLLESIYRHTDVPFHIFLIDNASTDETVDLHKIYTRNITIVRNRHNRGWCCSINQGLCLGNNPHAIFMKNDVEVSQGWLGNLIAFLNTHPRIGAVGPLNSNPGDWQCIDRIREENVQKIPQFFTEDVHERNRILRYHFHRAGILIEGMLTFSCIAIKRRILNSVGYLNEDMAEGIDSDDYCRRLRSAGYVLGVSLDTYVIQHSNSSVKTIRETAEHRELC